MEKNHIKGYMDKIKNLKKDQLLILLLAGILLIVIAIPVKSDGKTANEQTPAEEQSVLAASGYPAVSDLSYETAIETKLKGILSEVEGVGQVEVMITIKSKGEKVVEKDESNSSQTAQETDSSGGTRNTEDVTSQESTVFAENSDGKQVPYVVEEISPQIEGVLVIAQGGDNSVIVKNIMEAVMALFQVDAHKIKVMKMNLQEGLQ